LHSNLLAVLRHVEPAHWCEKRSESDDAGDAADVEIVVPVVEDAAVELANVVGGESVVNPGGNDAQRSLTFRRNSRRSSVENSQHHRSFRR
jgi:hypothetical protein